MDNIIKQLKNGAKHTRLSFTEKAELRNTLLQHIKENPVKTSMFQKQSIPSLFSIQNFRNKKSLSVLVIGGLLLGSSASFAGEFTVPGDALYPVKIHVNEQVRSVILMTPKLKAQWEVRLAERRLEEVEKIATNTNASNEVKMLAEKNLEVYTERVNQRISKFEKNNNDEDAINTAGIFKEMLRKHEEAIDNLDKNEKIGEVVHKLDVKSANTTKLEDVDKKEPLTEVREKLRGAHREAERKHEELKEKYNNKIVEEDKFKNYKGEEIRSSYETRRENKDEKEQKNN